MPLTLRSGGESRMDGAPDQLLPPFADGVEALAQAILADDTDNVYGGDINLARQIARQQLGEMSARSRAGQAAAEQAGADRNRARAARQGVSPESLPMDEYGSVSGRTVRDANLPIDEQEARQDQYDDLASDEIKAMREGRFHGAEAQARQYEQDYSLPTTRSKTGKTDLDYLREIQQHQGFIRTGNGEMIPVGPAITPERIAARRDFNEWANQTPGTERQALYDPAGYEEFREGVRQDIQDSAQADAAMYGTGPDDNGRRARLGLPPLTADQETLRADRAESENRVRQAQRGRFYEDKLMVDAGLTPPKPGPGAGIQDLERAAFRGRYARRQAELDRRKQNRIDQAMMAGGQPTGGPFGTRATTTAINQLGPGWREIALLDRLTQGRVGGPTPLAVEGANAAAAAQMAQQAMVAFLRNNPGATPEQAAAAQQQLRGLNPAAAGAQDIARGQLDTPEAQAEMSRLSESLDNTWGGMSADNEAAMAATLQRPPYNLDQPTAEEMAYRYAQKRRWSSRQRNAPAPEDTGLPPPGSVAPPF